MWKNEMNVSMHTARKVRSYTISAPKPKRRMVPMSDAMRDRFNEVIYRVKSSEGDITDMHLDHGSTCSNAGDRSIFASYTPWGVFVIEQTFLDRMNTVVVGDSKRVIKRDIQTNPHLHPKLKARLLRTLRRTSVRFNVVRYLDSLYCARIRGLVEGDDRAAALEAELIDQTNLPDEYRENLIENLRSWIAIDSAAE